MKSTSPANHAKPVFFQVQGTQVQEKAFKVENFTHQIHSDDPTRSIIAVAEVTVYDRLPARHFLENAVTDYVGTVIGGAGFVRFFYEGKLDSYPLKLGDIVRLPRTAVYAFECPASCGPLKIAIMAPGFPGWILDQQDEVETPTVTVT